jgi:uncharacterized membrane protein YdjX (TVP38/TMEM64 family)
MKSRKWVILLVLILALSVVSAFLPLRTWTQSLTGTLEGMGPLGVVAFALVYAAATVLFIPGSVLTLAAGVIFGVLLGTVAAWSGALLGSALAFLIGRYFVRSSIEETTQSNPRFRAIDEAIGRQGWKIVGLLRLSPLIPFNLSNYFYGVTKVGFWPYVLASGIGMLPGTLLYVYLGAVGKAGLGGGAKPHSPLQYVFFGVGLVVTLAVTIWVSRIAKNALQHAGALQPGQAAR